jgi:hypothetical protein
MKRKLLVSLVLVLLLASLSFAAVTAGEDATVYVAHGIPGAVVDVQVEGLGCALTDFEFETITPGIQVPADTYLVEIFLAVDGDGNDCEGTKVLEAGVPFAKGESATVVAHLTGDGNPGPADVDLERLGITATKFVNNLDPIVPGKARLTVRHAAWAPPVDITLNRGWGRGRPMSDLEIENLSNGEQFVLDIRPGAYQASIFPAEGSDAVGDPLLVELEPFKSYIVYAVGNLNGGSFTILTQVIEGLNKAMPPRPNPPRP